VWRILHNNYCAGDKIENNEMAGHVARDGGRKRRVQLLVGKTEGKRPLGRPRLRWEDNINVDFLEEGCGVWIGLSGLRIETGGGHF
jgi:hypothetical protein